MSLILFIVTCIPLVNGQTNEALLSRGTTCTSVAVNSQNCQKAFDGITTQYEAANMFEILDTNIKPWMQISFNREVTLSSIKFYHTFHAVEQNCKDIELQFSDGSNQVLTLINRVQGPDQEDTFVFSTRSNINALNVICQTVYNSTKRYTAFREIEVYDRAPFVPPPTFIPPTTTTTPTSTTTPTTTTTPLPTTTPTTTTTVPTTTPTTTTTVPTTTPTTTTTVPTTTTTPTTITKPTTTTPTPTTPTTTITNTLTPNVTSTSSTSTPTVTTGGVEGRRAGYELFDAAIADKFIAVVIGVAALVLIILVAGLVVLACRLCRNREAKPDEKPLTGVPAPVIYQNGAMPALGRNSHKVTVLQVEDDSAKGASLPSAPPGAPVMVDQLAAYVCRMDDTEGAFVREFKSLPSGIQGTANAGLRPAVTKKNRFRNILPYDTDRVVLSTMGMDPDSTYINASYIDGYSGPRQYIAAQGPNEQTIGDFWRMVWEKNVTIVVMLANIDENGKRKCEQYWPSSGSQAYTNIEVTFDHEVTGADYTIRHFNVRKDIEQRSVRQYHYTSWPDEGVPDTATALLSFYSQIRADHTKTRSSAGGAGEPPPIIVHCSAGVGRTGTLLALAVLLEQASAEQLVDVVGAVLGLRRHRPNMVQSLEQYRFLHYMLLEALSCGDAGVSVPCSQFLAEYQRLQGGEPRLLQRQFETLEVFKNRKYREMCDAAKDAKNKDKIRNPKIICSDQHRAHLLPLTDYPHTFINAVFSKGYKTRNSLLISQSPLDRSIVDMWRLIADFDCRTIVRLNPVSEDTPSYLPSPQGVEEEEEGVGSEMTLGPFTITTSGREEEGGVTVTKLELKTEHRPSEGLVSVQHYALSGWSPDSPLPPNLATLPALIQQVDKWHRQVPGSRTLVHCLDGGEHSGLYCTMAYMLEKMNTEQEVDVFNAVKNTRFCHPEFIPNIEQYEYLYEVAKHQMEINDTCANFK